jgi:3-hydroxyisobutyrate dehydrogenase
MGGPMASHLARAGATVCIWNRTPGRETAAQAVDAGARSMPTIADAVSDAEVVFVCVGDVPDVRDVVLGAAGVAESAQPGTLIVDCSTIGTSAASSLGAELAQRDLRFVDAPVSGGDIGARKGTLTFMVGGDEKDFADARPFFEVMGRHITHCGPIGSGQSVKLINNMLCAIKTVAVAEGMAAAHRLGVDPQLIVDVCSTGAAGSWSLSQLGPRIVADNLAPGFAARHLVKDLRLAADALHAGDDATEAGLPAFELAQRLFAELAELPGGADQGTHAVIRLYADERARGSE